jgi:hypothetical protein
MAYAPLIRCTTCTVWRVALAVTLLALAGSWLVSGYW